MFVATDAKLLMVQPEPVIAELTSFRLELLGYGIQVFEDSAKALSAIQKNLPGLVIVDTRLSEGDGIEWIVRLRDEYTVAQLPILVFSQDPSLETVERAFAAGAQDYILTPYDPTVLEEKIEKLLSLHVASLRRQ